MAHFARRRRAIARRHRRQLPSLGRHRRPLPRRDDPHRRPWLLPASRASACSTSCRSGRASSASSITSSTKSRTTRSSPTPTSSSRADGVNSRTAPAATRRCSSRTSTCASAASSGSARTQTLPRLHLRVRANGARLVPDPRLPVQQGPLDVHRRDARGDLARARPRSVDHEQSIAFCEKLFAHISTATGSMSNAAHLRGSAWLNFHRVLCKRWHHGNRRADRRRRAHRALLDRLGHEARDGGCDRARRARHARQRDVHAALAAYQEERSARGAEAAERGAQPHGVVRERRALHAPRARAVRLQPAHRQPAHRSREPEAARPGSSAESKRGSRERAGAADAAAADVPAVQAARPDARESRRRLADGAVLAVDGMPDDWHLVHYGARAHWAAPGSCSPR